ncbi:3143_t:CDS:2 [Rhizophagus irregularis]|nr:3143_t:CDS:2 [Rhizophagus irregularis]
MAPKLWIYLRQSKCQHSLSLSVPAAAAAPISYDRSPIPGQMPPAMPPGMAPRQTMKMYQDKAIIK